MALMKGAQVPKDAVALDELEAMSYVWEIVDNWESWKDVWALRYGPLVLGGLNAMTGLVINKHYRWRLKLGTYGYMSSSIPITVMPGLLTLIFHKHLISSGLLLMKNDNCPVCYEIKSSAIQLGLGTVYPMVLAPTSALMFANRYSTYRVPNLLEGPKVMLKFLAKHTKPFTSTLSCIVLIQLVASAFFTTYEMRNAVQVRHKMLASESSKEELTELT